MSEDKENREVPTPSEDAGHRSAVLESPTLDSSESSLRRSLLELGFSNSGVAELEKIEALIEETSPSPPQGRDLYCNRTLNMRSLQAIGYDMDYTLIHYRIDEWERRSYEHLRRRLVQKGWPVEGLEFEPELMVRGLVIDRELGNIVKANRFGYIKRAFHGTRPLPFEELRNTYSRTIVDLSEPRWSFVNTFFSLSECCMYAQLVELLDEGKLPRAVGYEELHRRVVTALDEAHMEGALKAEIIADPGRFVVLDPETPLTLLDQQRAGKQLMLITNSEWTYTRSMMAFSFDPFLPKGMSWKELFDVVIVGARKPDFFLGHAPIFEVVNEEGLLRPALALREGGIFLGGSARQVERHLKLSGSEILYVGDHMYGDVHVSKNILRWRTALIVRELEGEVEAEEGFGAKQWRLDALMAQKSRIEHLMSQLRLQLLRSAKAYGPRVSIDASELESAVNACRSRLSELDSEISPLARSAGELGNANWGPLMRAGNDKSHLARQLERYSDVYTSRVSNFLFRSPFAYLRPSRGMMPHDPASKRTLGGEEEG